MSRWKMGVVAPMYNNSFKWGTRVYAKVSAPENLATGERVTSLGSIHLSYQDDYGTDLGLGDGLVKFMRVGDRIRVGPSTYSGYEGSSQDFLITTINDSAFIVSPGAYIRFNHEDPIVGFGTNCPGGWDPEQGGSLTMGGITNHDIISLTTAPGNLDRYSIQFRGSGSGSNGIRWNFDLDAFESSTYYRIGYYYQMTSTGGYLASQLIANSSQFSTCNTSDDVSAWTGLNGVTAQSPGSVGSAFYCDIYISGTALGGYVTANIDNFYAEHAKHTDDESSAVYTFDDYPSLGSRKYSLVNASKYSRLVNQRLVRASVGSDVEKKYVVSAAFKDVGIDLRNNLEVFSDWQDRGSLSVLHHDIPEVPPNLHGILTIKDTNMSHWSSGKCSFSITFEES